MQIADSTDSRTMNIRQMTAHCEYSHNRHTEQLLLESRHVHDARLYSENTPDDQAMTLAMILKKPCTTNVPAHGHNHGSGGTHCTFPEDLRIRSFFVFSAMQELFAYASSELLLNHRNQSSSANEKSHISRDLIMSDRAAPKIQPISSSAAYPDLTKWVKPLPISSVKAV